jgi:hypothetical protein
MLARAKGFRWPTCLEMTYRLVPLLTKFFPPPPKGTCLWSQETRVQIQVLPSTGCMILSNSANFCEPYFPINGYNKSCFINCYDGETK